MLSRRTFLKTIGLGALGVYRPVVLCLCHRAALSACDHPLSPAAAELAGGAEPLRMAVIADIHACDPWMPLTRVAEIVAVANELRA